MTLEERFNALKEQWDIVESRHNKFVDKGNKTAEADARKALGTMKNMVTEYRKASVLATKKI